MSKSTKKIKNNDRKFKKCTKNLKKKRKFKKSPIIQKDILKSTKNSTKCVKND